MTYLTSAEVQEKMAVQLATTPVDRSVLASPAIRDNPALMASMEQIAHGRPMPIRAADAADLGRNARAVSAGDERRDHRERSGATDAARGGEEHRRQQSLAGQIGNGCGAFAVAHEVNPAANSARAGAEGMSEGGCEALANADESVSHPCGAPAVAHASRKIAYAVPRDSYRAPRITHGSFPVAYESRDDWHEARADSYESALLRMNRHAFHAKRWTNHLFPRRFGWIAGYFRMDRPPFQMERGAPDMRFRRFWPRLG